jgi:hypothetical protein
MNERNVQTLIEPDADQMLCHLEHLFGGDLDGCHEGRIELAWSEGDDGSPRHAAIFNTSEIEELVERAVNENQIPGRNVYVGQALRKDDIPPFGRCNDQDFLALTTFYVDLDEDGAVAAARKVYRDRDCPPTAVVVTGRHPHIRAQMLWRQETPERDPDACRRQNKALADALGGDPMVVNPSRVMRLGGSIAWPTKPGRIAERTEFATFEDDRPKVYYPGQLAKAFPPINNDTSTSPVDHVGKEPAPQQATTLNIGSEFDGVTVEACLAAIRAGDRWHNNMVRLTAHWIARSWSDTEILTAVEALTLPGYTVEQTRIEVGKMLRGGRTKWNVASPEQIIEDDPPVPFRLLDWTADRYAGQARPITWLCEGTIPLAAPVLLAAMGGLGKSYLAIDLALQIAVGVIGLEQPKTVLGGKVIAQGSAVVISAEDSFDAIHRRLNRIDPGERRLNDPQRLIIVPLADASGPQPLIAVEAGVPAKTAFFQTLKTQLVAFADLKLVVIDPLQAFVMADVNSDPAAGQYMWTAIAELCAATGATVIVTHHMRKDGLSRIDSADDAREAIRGSTALVDGARVSYALWKTDAETARALCLQLDVEYENGRIVQGAVVKANDEANYVVHTYVREESGLLTDRGDVTGAMDVAQTGPTLQKARDILKEIQRRFDEGTPFSHAPNSGPRYLIHFFMRQHGMNRSAAKNLLTDWLNNNVVIVDVCDRKTKMAGLKVVQWL